MVSSKQLYTPSFLKNFFPSSFTEGRNALSLASDGLKVLNILLTRTHSRMTDVWACDKRIPQYSDHYYLDDYCIAMQEYFNIQRMCERKYEPNEQSRMFIPKIEITLSTNEVIQVKFLTNTYL